MENKIQEIPLNSIQEMRLERLNKGFNFFNLVQTEKKHYINVELETEQDLNRKKETINVTSNLDDVGHYWGCDVSEFLKELEKFCKKPFAEIRTSNRKEEVSSYDLRHLVRDETLKFSDIEITIGDLAREKLKEMNIDFEEQVKTLLKKQKFIGKEVQNKIDRYVILREKIEVLKSLLKKEDRYSYSQPKDNTLKMILSPQEYNSKLKKIEVELRKIEKLFGLREERIDYIKIEEELDFKSWLKKNEESLREQFEESECDMPFNEWAEQVFEQEEDKEQEFEEEYEDEEE